MSSIIRKIIKSVSLNTGIAIKKQPSRKGHTGFLSCRELRLLNVPLIYGAQGTVFENGVESKAWQHGPHYDKYNLDGRPLDMSITNPYGDLIYVRLRSGQIVNTTKNRSEKNRKSVIRSIKKVKRLSRLQQVAA